jgi:hypothetical protein
MSLRPAKKRKVDGKTSSSKNAVITNLEEKISAAIDSGDSLNELLELLQYTTTKDNAAKKHQGIWALYRLFSRLIEKKRLFEKAANADANLVREWLMARFSDYTDLLVTLLQHEELQMRVSASYK